MLLNKKECINWTLDFKQSFNAMLIMLINQPVIVYYDPEEKKLIVDGSNKTELCSILTQHNPESG